MKGFAAGEKDLTGAVVVGVYQGPVNERFKKVTALIVEIDGEQRVVFYDSHIKALRSTLRP